MTSKKPSNSPIEPYWRLLGIGIDPDIAMPELYGAIHEGEADVPLMIDDRLVFFTDPGRAPELIRLYGGLLASDKMDVGKPSFWCDVTKTLHLLSADGIDNTAVVLNAVNGLLDRLCRRRQDVVPRQGLIVALVIGAPLTYGLAKCSFAGCHALFGIPLVLDAGFLTLATLGPD